MVVSCLKMKFKKHCPSVIYLPLLIAGSPTQFAHFAVCGTAFDPFHEAAEKVLKLINPFIINKKYYMYCAQFTINFLFSK